MALTPAQELVVKAAVEGDPTLNDFLIVGNYDGLADALSIESAPSYYVWRTFVTKDEVYANGFDWPQIDNVTEPRWRIWRELFDNEGRGLNPSKTNVRAGIGEVWSGTAGKVAVRDYVLGKCKRLASRYEALLAVGSGTQIAPSVFGLDTNGEPLEGRPKVIDLINIWR